MARRGNQVDTTDYDKARFSKLRNAHWAWRASHLGEPDS